MHSKTNKILSTIALVLGIVLMAATILGGIAVMVKANQVGDAISEIGDTEETSPDYYEQSGCDYEGGPDCEYTD